MAAIGLGKYRRSKRKEESNGQSLQTSKATANGTAPQKPELHGTVEEAANGEAEEILYPISFQQGCKRSWRVIIIRSKGEYLGSVEVTLR
jgi:hypothetical protein